MRTSSAQDDEKEITRTLDVISRREEQARLLAGSRHSDARHRVVATRYLEALEVFRIVLDRVRDDALAPEDPVVEAVARALARTPLRQKGDRG